MNDYKNLKTFEAACEVEGLDPRTVIPSFLCYPEKDRKAMIAHAKLIIIVRAANRIANDGKEWTPDWNDYNQWKYEAWFDMEDNEDGSSGFRFYDYDVWVTDSGVGSRLCFISRGVCEHVAEQFVDLYKDYLL